MTGLQNNLHRWYNPDLGRWLSQDPISFAGGDQNLYRYVTNSPTNFTDPFGLEGPSGWGWRKIGSTGGGATWVHRDGRVWKNGKYYAAEEWESYVPPPPEEEPDPCERPSAYTGKGFYDNWEIVAAENRANAKQHLKDIGEEIAWSAAAGPIGWVGRGAGKIGFKSFRAFKRAMGPAGEGRVWHHIVEKRATNIERFGAGNRSRPGIDFTDKLAFSQTFGCATSGAWRQRPRIESPSRLTRR